MIEILHFLMGAQCDKDAIFLKPPLRNEHFDLAGRRTLVERSGEQKSAVHIIEGYTSALPVAYTPKGGPRPLAASEARRSTRVISKSAIAK